MKHYQTALAIFAASANALHLDHQGTQGLEPLLLSSTEASADTRAQAASQVHAQVNAEVTDDSTARLDAIEERFEKFEKISAFFGDTCITQTDHTCYCLSTQVTHPIIVHEEDGKTISVKLFDKVF